MKTPPFFPTARQSGSALLLVLWAVVTMSVTVLGVVEYVNYNLDEAQALNADFRTRQIADSGAAIALSADLKEGDLLLQGTMPDDGRYEVHLFSESARLNINFLIRTGREDVLEQLFVVWKVPSSDARIVVKDVIRWMGRTEDPQHNLLVEREFERVEQMVEIPSMARVEKHQPAWREAFTTWGNGQIDINKATPDLLQAFFGISESQAQRFVTTRNGPDGAADTQDDQPYDNAKLVAGALGLSTQRFEPYASLVAFKTGILRVESTGTLGNLHKTVRMIINRQTTPPAIYSREETL